MAWYDRPRDYEKALLASVTATTTSTGTTATRIPDHQEAVIAYLDVTAAATGDALDKLDVYVQTKIGDEWLDVIRFTQIDGDSGAVTYVAKVEVNTACAEYETGTGLAEANARDIIGDQWRTRYVITDGAGAGTHSFTFSVTICVA
jgi:hypothetical protein